MKARQSVNFDNFFGVILRFFEGEIHSRDDVEMLGRFRANFEAF